MKVVLLAQMERIIRDQIVAKSNRVKLWENPFRHSLKSFVVKTPRGLAVDARLAKACIEYYRAYDSYTETLIKYANENDLDYNPRGVRNRKPIETTVEATDDGFEYDHAIPTNKRGRKNVK